MNRRRPRIRGVLFVILSWYMRGIEKETGRMGWQRPTLPHRYQCSTIGSCGLNFRVRDGTGCTPTDLATNTLSPTSHLGGIALLFAVYE